jgi:hypothetical protein
MCLFVKPKKLLDLKNKAMKKDSLNDNGIKIVTAKCLNPECDKDFKVQNSYLKRSKYCCLPCKNRAAYLRKHPEEISKKAPIRIGDPFISGFMRFPNESGAEYFSRYLKTPEARKLIYSVAYAWFGNKWGWFRGKKKPAAVAPVVPAASAPVVKDNKHDGNLPLSPDHICFDKGHAMYKVCRINNGRSVYGEHKCSRCGYVEPFQFDYN